MRYLKGKMKKELFGDLEHYYANFYHLMIGYKSKGFSKYLSEYPHKLIESKHKQNTSLKILEVGVGDFEHLPFVEGNYEKYVGVDKREPKNIDPQKQSNIHFIMADAQELPFSDEHFDRVIATCLIVHLQDPEKAIIEWLRVLKPDGLLTIYIALEPSIFLTLFRKLYMRRKANKLGYLGYDLFIARDHITYGIRIINIIKAKYKKSSKLIFRPFPKCSPFLNAFCVAEIKKPGK
jgi:ubiquinone/menaquinone biosynthesis C-methylase UbiE